MSKIRIKSVLKPSAQTAKLCDTDTHNEQVFYQVLALVDHSSFLPDYLKALIELQFFNGIRITSCLSLSYSDIDMFGNIYVTQGKGSENKICSVLNSKGFFINCRKRKVSPFEGISRFHVYREYKKLGISYQSKGNKNKSITHAFRHFYIENNRNNQIDDTDIQKFTGHKSLKSLKHYGNKKD